MTTNAFAQRRRFLTGVVLSVLLATACDSAKAPTSPAALPAPIQHRGVLTVEVRSETDGDVATLTCHYGGCPPWGVKASSVSIPVLASRPPFYFSVQIPRARAPQRYEIQTASLR